MASVCPEVDVGLGFGRRQEKRLLSAAAWQCLFLCHPEGIHSSLARDRRTPKYVELRNALELVPRKKGQ